MDDSLHRHLRPPMEQYQLQSPQGPWYPPSQFQYHHHPQQQQQQIPPPWVPVSDLPPAQFMQPRPALPPPPHYGPYPPPLPHYAPPPPWPVPPPQVTQMYGQPDQPWSNSNWPQNQYPDHTITNYNEEDWAAKARAWAAAKAAMDNQHNQPHISPHARIEEHNSAYHEYHQASEPHGTDMQNTLIPGPNNQRISTSHFPPHAPFGHEIPSYAPYAANVSTSAADGKLVSVTTEGSIFSNSSVYHQELPSNYSSAPGDKVVGYESGSCHSSTQIPLSSASGDDFHSQAALPVTASPTRRYTSYAYGEKKSAESGRESHSQPMEFERSSVHENQHEFSYLQSASTGLVGSSDQDAPVAAMHAWTAPVVPVVLPPVPPAPQFENMSLPHVLPGHSAPPFGPGIAPTFHPNVAPIGASFTLSPGAPLHLAPSFPGDVTVNFGISERPKKASVPIWLREEIMKKKAAVISGSVQDESLGHSNDSDMVLRKVDQDDRKSVNSTKSTEDEEDEVDEEAEKLAAINQEIKRVLTEVLLKVTDDLFDEIATKVMEDDDISVEVPTSNSLSPAIPAALTPKASARVLISGKLNNSGEADIEEESSASLAGNVLGLANYASDDDNENESPEKTTRLNINDVDGGDSLVRVAKNAQNAIHEEAKRPHNVGNHQAVAPSNSVSQTALGNKNPNDTTREVPALSSSNLQPEDGNAPLTFVAHSVRKEGKNDAESRRGTDTSRSASIPIFPEGDTEHANANIKSFTEKTRDERFQDHDFKRSSGSEVNSRKGSCVSSREQKESVPEESHSFDARRARDNNRGLKEKTQERNEVDTLKDRGGKSMGGSLDADPRRNSNIVNVKEEHDKLAGKIKKSNLKLKEDSNKKRERPQEDKEDKTKHREKKDSHKKHHSTFGVGRSQRTEVSNFEQSASVRDSSDDDRKMQRHKQSPLRSRARKRQVSRSPNSRHSERKHSPYYSRDRRNRRSRSTSPVYHRH